MATQRAIHWFRQDLRLADNPSLRQASDRGSLLPIYILDDDNAAKHSMGGASRWWLHHSLQALNDALEGKLRFYRGAANEVLPQLCDEFNIASVHWNRCYEPWRIQRDLHIKQQLQRQGVTVNSCKASLLWEPWEILKSDGTPYRVFTPFYRRGCLEANAPGKPLPKPSAIHLARGKFNSLTLDELQLLPRIPWYKSLQPHWHIGEAGAQQDLKVFFDDGIQNYREGRNFPAQQSVSRLSPRLHFGELSPTQVWHAALLHGDNHNIDSFKTELGWREFAHSLLYHFPHLPEQNLQSKFDRFPWHHDATLLKRWQTGTTGYPIVDAGMRELWQTGYMHNRVRMIVGSFLVKNLLMHWQHGEAWFWNCLVDADLANNSASWQWVAGCGADAAPYFRIFNPVTQGEKFDPDGEYTRRFVPELVEMPAKYLFKPWQAPADVLQKAGVTLGETYPHPVVGLKNSRERALSAFQSLSDC